jgi:fermentation-respiration switch protein FrsA (DUF1100 family)
VTLRTLELFQGYEPGDYLKRISPTPLLMVVAPNDRLVAGELACEAFETASHLKKLVLVPGGHFDAYAGPGFEISSGRGARLVRRAPRHGRRRARGRGGGARLTRLDPLPRSPLAAREHARVRVAAPRLHVRHDALELAQREVALDARQRVAAVRARLRLRQPVAGDRLRRAGAR